MHSAVLFCCLLSFENNRSIFNIHCKFFDEKNLIFYFIYGHKFVKICVKLFNFAAIMEVNFTFCLCLLEDLRSHFTLLIEVTIFFQVCEKDGLKMNVDSNCIIFNNTLSGVYMFVFVGVCSPHINLGLEEECVI